MLNMYVTPASLSYLIQSILSFGVTAYFLYRIRTAAQRSQTALLWGFFVSVTVLSLLLFLEASLLRGQDFYVLFPQNAILGAGLICLLQFAYRFPNVSMRHRWETRLVLGGSVLYTLWEAQFAVHRFWLLLHAGQIIYRPEYADYPMVLEFLWVPVVLLRQSRRASAETAGASPVSLLRAVWRPHGHSARAARALALVYVFPVGLSLLNVLATFYLISREVYHVSLSFGISIALVTFAVVYLNHQPGTTSFIVKLAGVSLMLILFVLGTVGWVIAPLYAAQYRPDLPGRQTMRFLPNPHGGYDKTSAAFHFERDLGTKVNFTEEHERWGQWLDLEFAFVFYGREYRKICVSNDGALSFGQKVRYSYMHYHYGSTPMIFPMFLDLDPDTALGGVFVKQTATQVILTWNQMPSFYHPEMVFTFQVVLDRDGRIEMTYDTLPERLVFNPNEEPGANPWLVGMTPGGPHLPEIADIGPFPDTIAARGTLQDYHLGLGWYLNQVLVPLTYLMIGYSILVVVGLPIMLHTNLVRPLRALLKGVRQMNAGHYDEQVPVQYPDEIGFLTTAFNAMTAELHTLIQDLETRVAERTQALARAKALAEERQTTAESANQAKSLFLANMSHELRTPLNAILGFARLSAQQPNVSPELQENLTIINRSGDHLLTLINQVLDLSKIEAGKITLDENTFDLYLLLDEVVDLFRLRARQKGLRLDFYCARNVPRYIRSDEVKLRQVLINLLNNALKFTEEGDVQLSVNSKQLSGKPETLIAESHSSDTVYCLLFTVTDTGPGIAREEMDKLFEAFAQTATGRQTQEGTGLGLPISRKFVQLMGGDITVESEWQQGSTFIFEIQVGLVDRATSDKLQATPLKRVIALEPGQPQYRLLFVDDKPDNRHLLVKLLAPFGFALREAANGQEALDIWKSWHPHLIWMDIQMPVMDGYEATQHIRGLPKGHETKIIVLSASAFEEEHAAALARGCDDFLRKPLQEADMFHLLTKHLGVQFVYEAPCERPSWQETNTIQAPDDLSTALATLPAALSSQLEHAATICDIDTLGQVIAEIRHSNRSLADTLLSHVEQFEYLQIITAIQQSKILVIDE